ncbi:MAG TPA: DUF423 domain-containing protein [bacterium]|nr:DUF423 domain-containing protein [bacterium]
MQSRPHPFLIIGSLFGGLAVLFGAFGAHILESQIASGMLETFSTGVHYQMFHALALLAIAAFGSQGKNRRLHIAGWAFILGIILFSGSLFILVLSGIRWFGMITPFGGVAFLIGWGTLTAEGLRRNTNQGSA